MDFISLIRVSGLCFIRIYLWEHVFLLLWLGSASILLLSFPDLPNLGGTLVFYFSCDNMTAASGSVFWWYKNFLRHRTIFYGIEYWNFNITGHSHAWTLIPSSHRGRGLNFVNHAYSRTRHMCVCIQQSIEGSLCHNWAPMIVRIYALVLIQRLMDPFMFLSGSLMNNPSQWMLLDSHGFQF